MLSSSCCCCCRKSLQSCLTLCDPRDGSPPGSPVPGVLPGRCPNSLTLHSSSAVSWREKLAKSCITAPLCLSNYSHPSEKDVNPHQQTFIKYLLQILTWGFKEKWYMFLKKSKTQPCSQVSMVRLWRPKPKKVNNIKNAYKDWVE